MATFSAQDLNKHNFSYVRKVIDDISKRQSKPIKFEVKLQGKKKVYEGKVVYNKELKQIKKILDNKPTLNDLLRVIKTGSKFNPIFELKDSGTKFKWSDIDKSPYSGMGGKSRNSLGKALSDAGELATVMSLTKEINSPKDTGQKLFENDVDAFNDWIITFKHTKEAIESFIGGKMGDYVILHDATDKTEFKKIITDFCKKIKIPKDSWNPADIFLIRKRAQKQVINRLRGIVDNFSIQDGLVDIFNNELYRMFEKKLVYPISLKQLVSPKAKIEYNNKPGKSKIADYNIEIDHFNCNLSADGKEIGLFIFSNTDTKKKISMQVRGFPHGYGTAQTEITSDGTPTGGRLGKVPTYIIDRVFAEFGEERIKSIGFFGDKRMPFSKFDDKTKKEIFDWYKTVVKHPKAKDQNPLKFEDFEQLIEASKNDGQVAAAMCQKIQGLKLMYIFVKHAKDVRLMMNKMINGAKKISSDNGFFIKVY